MLEYCDMLFSSCYGARLDKTEDVCDPASTMLLNKAGWLSRRRCDSWHIDSEFVLAFWRSRGAVKVVLDAVISNVDESEQCREALSVVALRGGSRVQPNHLVGSATWRRVPGAAACLQDPGSLDVSNSYPPHNELWFAYSLYNKQVYM
jgi:hypothetical protein